MSKGLLCRHDPAYCKRFKKNKFNKLGLDFTGLEMSRQTAELGVAGQQKSITVFELKNIKCSEKVVQAV